MSLIIKMRNSEVGEDTCLPADLDLSGPAGSYQIAKDFFFVNEDKTFEEIIFWGTYNPEVNPLNALEVLNLAFQSSPTLPNRVTFISSLGQNLIVDYLKNGIWAVENGESKHVGKNFFAMPNAPTFFVASTDTTRIDNATQLTE